MRPKSVLILSADPVVAALLGAAVELQNFTPLFADADESPREALLRLRPRLVLVDCQHGTACADAFFGPAMMTGARIIVFGPQWLRQNLADLGERHDVVTLVLPDNLAELSRLVAEWMVV